MRLEEREIETAMSIFRAASALQCSKHVGVRPGTINRMNTVTLYRPVGPAELALIEASGWRHFPPRLPEQPIFHPVLNEQYAVQIAQQWNVKESGSGFVTKFAIEADFASRYTAHTVGGSIHKELWVPAEELAAFNRHIVGTIEVIGEFHS